MHIRVKANTSELAIVLLTGLMLFLSLPLGSVWASSPTAEIVSIHYPIHVLPGSVFPVTVETDYSIQGGADVGIWDVETGVMLQSFSIPVPGAGRESFDFKLTAPSVEGDWHLIAITRIWWIDAWYRNPNGGSENFTINVSDRVTIVLSSVGGGSTIDVDGSQYSVAGNKSATLMLNVGVHTLEAPTIIQTDPLKRFVFVGWSDGVNSNPRQLVISDDGKITSLYRTEYYLSVKSEMGQVSGEGWYERGSQASFAIAPSSNVAPKFGFLTDHYIFNGWSGDIESNDVVTSISMDGPKTVEATWVHSGTSISLVLVSDIFYVGALGLAVRGLHKYSEERRAKITISPHALKHLVTLIIPLSIILVAAVLVPPVSGQLPDPPSRSIVTIGDASWYYWKQNASDTCLIWLGGGIAQEAGVGYSQYWTNPYEYESFGTIRFLQDLTKYYCVIALEKGSYKYVQADSNSVIYQEPYQLQSQIITQVHNWIKAQGYAHTYLIGYSVGAAVAAMEVSIDPEEWTSPDGLILITPYLSDDQIRSAYHTRTSLLVLYGGDIETPQYIATGQDFYNETPTDGWHDSYYQHKEFHVIPMMGHEVWTALETGRYDSQALNILVNFVEKSKALQLKSEDVHSIISQVGNSTQKDPYATIPSLKAPQEIASDQVLIIQANLSYSTQTKLLIRVMTLDNRSAQIESVLDFSVFGVGQRVFNLLVSPPFNSSRVSLEIIILRNTGAGWLPTSRPYLTTTNITGPFTATLETNAPNVRLLYDGIQYTVSTPVSLETTQGRHTVQVPPFIYLNGLTRVAFTRWEDGTPTPVRQVILDSSATLVAYYRMQYFVNATSSFGQVEGSGWYDENSTATILLQPPMISETDVLFSHWTGDSNDTNPRTLLFVNSPKTIQAGWSSIGRLNESNYFDMSAMMLPSVTLFVILLILNLKRAKH